MDPETKLAIVSRAQHGAFTTKQALEAEFTEAQVKRFVRIGRWRRVYRGVLAEASGRATFERTTSAAVLACGEGAAASHRNAGRFWGLDVPLLEVPEVTVLAPSRSRPTAILVHTTDRLTRSEAAVRDGIRITSPMRTLGDLAGVVEPKLLELGHDVLWRRGLVHPARLLDYLSDDWWSRRPGTGVLRALARERLGQGPSGSDLETLLFQLIRDSGLPLPVRQHPVVTPFGVRYIDLAYPGPKLAIELDGMESRLDPTVFLDERVRQNLITAQGWTFKRFGYSHVTDSGLMVLVTLGEALRLRPVRWRAYGSGRRAFQFS